MCTFSSSKISTSCSRFFFIFPIHYHHSMILLTFSRELTSWYVIKFTNFLFLFKGIEVLVSGLDLPRSHYLNPRTIHTEVTFSNLSVNEFLGIYS